jgi:hypothetical protein
MRRFPLVTVIFTLAAAGLAHGEEPGEKPLLERKGRYVFQWKDDTFQLELGTRYASTKMGSPWIMLPVCMSGVGQKKPIRIDREDITLNVPGGTAVNLASQKALAEANPDLRKLYLEANIKQDPLEGYFIGQTDQQPLQFFSPPNQTVVYDQVTVDWHMLSCGYLFFHAPNDKAEPGRYSLNIYNKDVDAKLPFTLPAPDDFSKKGKKAKDDKSVPW